MHSVCAVRLQLRPIHRRHARWQQVAFSSPPPHCTPCPPQRQCGLHSLACTVSGALAAVNFLLTRPASSASLPLAAAKDSAAGLATRFRPSFSNLFSSWWNGARPHPTQCVPRLRPWTPCVMPSALVLRVAGIMDRLLETVMMSWAHCFAVLPHGTKRPGLPAIGGGGVGPDHPSPPSNWPLTGSERSWSDRPCTQGA